jgi:hypothetical protein
VKALNLAYLNAIAKEQAEGKSILLDRPRVAQLIDYARERAAREACEAAWDGDIDTDQHGGTVRAWAWHGTTTQHVAIAETFTDAYLALLAKLEQSAS